MSEWSRKLEDKIQLNMMRHSSGFMLSYVFRQQWFNTSTLSLMKRYEGTLYNLWVMWLGNNELTCHSHASPRLSRPKLHSAQASSHIWPSCKPSCSCHFHRHRPIFAHRCLVSLLRYSFWLSRPLPDLATEGGLIRVSAQQLLCTFCVILSSPSW